MTGEIGDVEKIYDEKKTEIGNDVEVNEKTGKSGTRETSVKSKMNLIGEELEKLLSRTVERHCKRGFDYGKRKGLQC